MIVIGDFQGFGVNLLISGSYYGYVVLVSFMKADGLGSPMEILELCIVCRIPGRIQLLVGKIVVKNESKLQKYPV